MVQITDDTECKKIQNNAALNEKNLVAFNIEQKHDPGDFETAISATGFGKFNIILFIIALPSTWSSEFDFTSTSYILPAAQCDLHLTLINKGMLNAVTYLGTVSSAFLWGFLADTLGRRKLLVYGYFIDAFFVILSSFSQNFWTLFFIKYINGFIICGPYAILMSFISEFHSAKYRAPILILTGLFFSLANVAMSGLAWWIIPQDISFKLFNGSFDVHSWQVFLIVCSLPSIISGFAYLKLPESPKFLMTAGRNEEAMEVFKKIYSMNSGNPPEHYPVKRLVIENPDYKLKDIKQLDNEKGHIEVDKDDKKVQFQGIRDGWRQIRPMFCPPYLTRIIHIFTILFLGLLGENTLRLWLPQLFTKMDEYGQFHNYTETTSLCNMLEFSPEVKYVDVNATILKEICTVVDVDKQVYINTMVVATSNFIGFIVASSVVNKIGKKTLLVVMYAACGLAGIGNYWSTSAAITLFLVSIHGGVASVCTSTMISVIVDLFPTTLRTMTISLGMMFGRMGSIIGNILFPVLLTTGCLPPFLLIGCTAIACSIFSLLLPNTKMKNLD